MEARMGEDPSQAGLQVCREPDPVRGMPDRPSKSDEKSLSWVMCNDYEQPIRWAEYCKMMQDLGLGIPTQQTELDLPQSDDVKINDMGRSCARPAI